MASKFFTPKGKDSAQGSSSKPSRDSEDKSRGPSARDQRKAIADSTLKAIQNGSYILGGHRVDLGASVAETVKGTEFLAEDSWLEGWEQPAVATLADSQPRDGDESPRKKPRLQTMMAVLEVSTIEASRSLALQFPNSTCGMLNFASAKKEGGGFLSGAQAQEESLARASTLYPSLMCPAGQEFYKLHHKDANGCFYTHSMIWSPDVLFIRDDEGTWTTPFPAHVVTSPAVNAGVVRGRIDVKISKDAAQRAENKIEAEMLERMGRILYLFEGKQVKNICLGSFGTGVFKNKIEFVARTWAELLGRGARFEGVFQNVLFGVIGQPTFAIFKAEFEKRIQELADGAP